MPVWFLTDEDRASFITFSKEVQVDDIIAYFTMSDADKSVITKATSDTNNLWFAVQTGILRFLVFCQDDLSTVPTEVIRHVARQLGVSPDAFALYGERAHTSTDHVFEIQRYLGFRKVQPNDHETLSSWLLELALEHDRPKFLLQSVCEELHQGKIIRPVISVLGRMVTTAQNQVKGETFTRFTTVLTDELKILLDNLLVPGKQTNRTPLTWLSQPAISNTSPAILAQLEKLKYIKSLPIAKLDLSMISPNRLKFLAQLGKRSTNQALQRASAQRRYPILLAFLYQSLRDLTDEIMDMYDACLEDAYRDARHDLDDFRKKIYKSANEKVLMLEELGEIVLDEKISDEKLREVIYRYFPPEQLQSVIQECQNIVRTIQDHYYDFLATSYRYLRQFVPTFLESFSFQANPNFLLVTWKSLILAAIFTIKNGVPSKLSIPLIDLSVFAASGYK